MTVLTERIANSTSQLSKVIFSNPVSKETGDIIKINIVRIKNKGSVTYQAQESTNTQVFHKNLNENALLPYIDEKWNSGCFKQVNLLFEDKDICFRASKKGKISETVDKKNKTAATPTSHNEKKNYLINEGDKVDFLIDLGVFTKEYKVVNAYYDKFKQINRFLEILDHALKEYSKSEISVLDFGCGKSYLTFFVYYYFKIIRNINVKIIGYDLKAEVVNNCNTLAQKYSFDNLEFVVADVTKDTLYDQKIDMVISLHACDIATDFALNYALEHNVSYIFSVPCCQHEINNTISKSNGDFDILLKHGLTKERFSALLTDSIRAEILERMGYSVDLIEFVDFAHSPKNIMIRAKRKLQYKSKGFDDLLELEKKYNYNQKLLHLVLDKEK